ncbi:MAG: LptF/LptG family permease [Rhodothalassiaceae bacterium]
MIRRIDLYVLRRVAIPFGITVLIAALLLLLERMLRLFNFVVNENGPADVVWQMLAHLVPHYLGLALPVGAFLGMLLAFRSLSLSSELDALFAAGAGLPRLMAPLLVMAVLLGAADVWLVGYLQPFSRYAYRQLDFELRSGALGASIRVGEFVPLGENLLLRVGATREGGRELDEIFLRRETVHGEEITATAKRGGFFATEDDQTILLRLYDGRLIEFDPEYRTPRVLSFRSQDIVVDLPRIEAFRRRGGEELELTLGELSAAIDDPATPPNDRRRFLGNFHWRLLHILTFLALPFVAVPLGIANKRTAAAGSIVAGLALLIVYNELSEAAERQVALAGASPYLTIWTLYGLLLALGVVLFVSAAYRPGRGVAGLIDRVAEGLLRPLRRLVAGIREAVAR